MTAPSDPVDEVLAAADLPVLSGVSAILAAATAGDVVMRARQAYGGAIMMPAIDVFTALVRAAHPNAHRLTIRQVGTLRRKVYAAIAEKETPT